MSLTEQSNSIMYFNNILSSRNGGKVRYRLQDKKISLQRKVAYSKADPWTSSLFELPKDITELDSFILTHIDASNSWVSGLEKLQSFVAGGVEGEHPLI